MQWVNISPDYVRSFCGQYVCILHVVDGWALYDADEFVQSFETLTEAQTTAELMQSAGWDR